MENENKAAEAFARANVGKKVKTPHGEGIVLGYSAGISRNVITILVSSTLEIGWETPGKGDVFLMEIPVGCGAWAYLPYEIELIKD